MAFDVEFASEFVNELGASSVTVRGGVQPGGSVSSSILTSIHSFFSPKFFFSKKPFGNAWENPRKTFGKLFEKAFGKSLGKFPIEKRLGNSLEKPLGKAFGSSLRVNRVGRVLRDGVLGGSDSLSRDHLFVPELDATPHGA